MLKRNDGREGSFSRDGNLAYEEWTHKRDYYQPGLQAAFKRGFRKKRSSLLKIRRHPILISVYLSLLLLLLLLYNPMVIAEISTSDGKAVSEQTGQQNVDIDLGSSLNQSHNNQTSESCGMETDNHDTDSGEATEQAGTSSTSPVSPEADEHYSTLSESNQPQNGTDDNSSMTGSGNQIEPDSNLEQTADLTGLDDQDSQKPEGSAPNVDPGESKQDPDQAQAVNKIKVVGSISDSTVTMAAAYRNISIEDNSLQINLSSGTLKGSCGDDLTADINIEGLPQGLIWRAQNGGANNILITVTGPVSSFATDMAAISIIVKGGAVSEPEAGDSDALPASINLGGPIPDAIAVDPDGGVIYVFNRERCEVAVIDSANDTIKRIIMSGDCSNHGDECIAYGLLSMAG